MRRNEKESRRDKISAALLEINVCFSSENQAALGIISAVGITFMQKLARNSATLQRGAAAREEM